MFSEPAPGLDALKVYWNEALGAHEEIATAESEREAQAAGFAFDGGQGFVFADPPPTHGP